MHTIHDTDTRAARIATLLQDVGYQIASIMLHEALPAMAEEGCIDRGADYREIAYSAADDALKAVLRSLGVCAPQDVYAYVPLVRPHAEGGV